LGKIETGRLGKLAALWQLWEGRYTSAIEMCLWLVASASGTRGCDDVLGWVIPGKLGYMHGTSGRLYVAVSASGVTSYVVSTCEHKAVKYFLN
jgi:hypothetical protein